MGLYRYILSLANNRIARDAEKFRKFVEFFSLFSDVWDQGNKE